MRLMIRSFTVAAALLIWMTTGVIAWGRHQEAEPMWVIFNSRIGTEWQLFTVRVDGKFLRPLP
ncbi:MAG: hypothetical protein F9K46_19305, partial [Anaerolineae bacterium]